MNFEAIRKRKIAKDLEWGREEDYNRWSSALPRVQGCNRAEKKTATDGARLDEGCRAVAELEKRLQQMEVSEGCSRSIFMCGSNRWSLAW
ncbi:hypothetical protein PVL29_020304 [Vitis rotundifolia]|uniref:Uncharacterized protein n=1 Tax=Vitis rotundifolia TaxID=103349 RepID=A0AA38Z3E0_VITRO|nr:hypothetical protein PVL29_020304 [Vitis rotundifolia]